MRRPTENDSPSPIRWERAGVRVSVPQNPNLFLHESLVLHFINTTTFVAPIFGFGEARRGSIPRSGAVTEEQRGQNRKATQPSGRRCFSAQTLLLSLQTHEGYARRSRLVWAKNPSPQTWLYL